MPLAGGLVYPLGGDASPARGATWWGPWFPDFGGRSTWWGPWFPDGIPSANLVPGVGPAGAAQFALALESGATMTMSWLTDVEKNYDGTERRISRLDLPKRKISGQAHLVGGDAARSTRAEMARYAALGSPFLLALPFEELTMAADATDATVHVATTALIDWGVQGQRVIVQDGDDFSNAVVQVVGGDSIELDVSPGELGELGCRIMPAVAVFLDPQQAFARYPADPNDDLELWSITCSAVMFGYEQDVRRATASLADATGALSLAVIQYVNLGSAGNAFSIQFVGDSIVDAGNVTNSGDAYVYHFKPGVTVVDQMIGALGAVFGFAGTYDITDQLVAGDEIGPVQLSLGADKVWGAMGTGATVASFTGISSDLATLTNRPVWDRPLQLDATALDSVQSLSQIVDLGGELANIGTALQSDWGRAVMARSDIGLEWQWVKAFLNAVRGRARAFWLSTWRGDLTAVSYDTGVVTVEGPSFETGDFFGWFPQRRQNLQVMQSDGTVTRVSIVAAVDNGDGTIDLTVHDSSGSPAVFPDSDVTMVSWLELCRFESDDFQFTFTGSTFELQAQARAVQQ